MALKPLRVPRSVEIGTAIFFTVLWTGALITCVLVFVGYALSGILYSALTGYTPSSRHDYPT